MNFAKAFIILALLIAQQSEKHFIGKKKPNYPISRQPG
jgi:hypothetical protein